MSTTKRDEADLALDLAGVLRDRGLRKVLDDLAAKAQERREGSELPERLLKAAIAGVGDQARLRGFAEADVERLEERVEELELELATGKGELELARSDLSGMDALRMRHDAARGELAERRGQVDDLERRRKMLRQVLVSIRNSTASSELGAERQLADVAEAARQVLELDGDYDLAPAGVKRDILELGAQLGTAG